MKVGHVLIPLAFALVGCGTPGPERVCNHAVEVSQGVAANDCQGKLTALKEKEPQRYDGIARCLMAAKNQASVAACLEPLEQERREQTSHAGPTPAPQIPGIPLTREQAGQVTKIEISKGADHTVLEKQGGAWTLTAPTKGPAKDRPVTAVLDMLTQLRIRDAINATAASADLYSDYQVDDANAQHLTVWIGAEKKMDLYFGRSGARGQLVRLGDRPGVWSISGFSTYTLQGGVDKWVAQ